MKRLRDIAEYARYDTRNEVAYRSRYNGRVSHDEEAEIFEDKFAEYIINECAEVASNAHVSGVELVDLLKYHFNKETNDD